MAVTRRQRPHPKRGKVFFDTPFNLAQLFTRPNRLRYQRAKWFDSRGLKAIEAFQSDIRNSLIEWGCSGDSIFYRTEHFWYDFTVTPVEHTRELEILICTRYNNRTWERVDTWMNLHSCIVGKKWLMQEPQKSKWVKLFREEE